MPPFTLILLYVLCFSTVVVAVRSRNSFVHFFPEVAPELHDIVIHNCSDAYQQYINEHVILYGKNCVKMFTCIMEAAGEYTKSNMGSATVLLGLTPSILATVGSTTPELAFLASRRPLFTTLIVLGSPAVNALRSFHFSEAISGFVDHQAQTLAASNTRLPSANNQTHYVFHLQPKRQILISVLEIVVAIGSLCNIAQICYEINLKTIAVMSCDNSDMLVELWVGLAMVTHGLGVAAFFTRSRRLHRNCTEWLAYEVTASEFMPQKRLRWDPESNWKFIAFSWITTVFTVCHLAFGTLLFSSLMFVGTQYSAYIVGRFAISAILCRTIVAYELAAMGVTK
ncbi:hypothetical protein F5884DRAFT_852825 [Xylogone sp. PMI_703]|nr:hypothetical protein F5884DRAFT_852825 [Xylogone sp. PMI_703]